MKIECQSCGVVHELEDYVKSDSLCCIVCEGFIEPAVAVLYMPESKTDIDEFINKFLQKNGRR